MIIASSSLRQVFSVICLKYCRYGVKYYPINQLNLQLIPFSKFQKIVQVLVSRQCDSWTCYGYNFKTGVPQALTVRFYTNFLSDGLIFAKNKNQKWQKTAAKYSLDTIVFNVLYIDRAEDNSFPLYGLHGHALA